MESSKAHRRGYIREDGKIFWVKVKRKYDIWITKEKYEEYKRLQREYNNKYSRKEDYYKNKRINNKEYYQNNIEKERKRGKDKRDRMTKEQLEKLKEYKRNWHKKNVFKKMVSKHRRRELEKNNAPLTKNQAAIIATFYKQSKRLKKRLGIEFHVDHIIPLFMGGKHDPCNLQVIPARINLQKSYSKIFRWAETN
jgi:hypothetical protein